MGNQDYDRQDAESYKGHVWIGAILFGICLVLVVVKSGQTPSLPNLPQACQDINTCN